MGVASSVGRSGALRAEPATPSRAKPPAANAWACGHPHTPENTQRVGKAGVRCRECRQRITREHMRRKTGFYQRYPNVQPGER